MIFKPLDLILLATGDLRMNLNCYSACASFVSAHDRSDCDQLGHMCIVVKIWTIYNKFVFTEALFDSTGFIQSIALH